MKKPRIGLRIQGAAGSTYTIIDSLGHGAFGEVYRAVSEDGSKFVAVKLLPLVEDFEDQASRRALLQEVQAGTQIRHPNVVEILHVEDGGSDPDIGPFVMMGYVSGGNLSKLIREHRAAKSPLPLDTARKMMLDIAQGAKAINARLVHRDIKPDNILVDDGRLRIGDLGISKFVDAATRSKTFKGGQHMAYMAPEGWKGEANTFKVDVYSVGLVFGELLTLEHPLIGFVPDPTDWRNWEDAHLYKVPSDLRSKRPELDLPTAQLVSRMIGKRLQNRPDWDEVLRILSTPEAVAPQPNPSIAKAIEASIVKAREQQEVQLKQEAQARARQEAGKLYAHSCSELLEKFDKIATEFNAASQDRKMVIERTKVGFPGGE